MLANGTLEIRIAIPKKTFVGRGNGIFHEKLLIMEDNDGCFVDATGKSLKIFPIIWSRLSKEPTDRLL